MNKAFFQLTAGTAFNKTVKGFTKMTFLFVIFNFSMPFGFAQIGINNTSPNATLDIAASNVSAPANTDGILIPRVDNFPATNPTVSQEGMMIFVTGNGIPAKGFYYWDQNANDWVIIASGITADADWYEEGTTNAPDAITDDIYTQGNVGIGTTTVAYPLQVETTASSRTLSLSNAGNLTSIQGLRNQIIQSSPPATAGSTTGISNVITRTNQGLISGLSNTFPNSNATSSFGYMYGVENSFGTATANITVALLNRFQGSSNEAIGVRNIINGNITDFYGVQSYFINLSAISGNFYGMHNVSGGSSANGNYYGMYTDFSNTGTGAKYGDYINIAATAGGNHYGIYADVQKPSGYAGYFIGRTSLGNTTANRYLMPAADGSAGQVMTTDGAGQVSFTTVSITDTQNTLDQAYDEGGAGAGRTITADSGAFLVAGNDGFQNTGTLGSGAAIALTGAGTKMFFYPRKAAFRAGDVDGAQWNNVNIGDFSVAMGANTRASGVVATAFGNETVASGNSSTSFGISTTASGVNATAYGSTTTASGNNSTAFGFLNTSSGFGSIAMGHGNTAHSSFETVTGNFSTNYTPIQSTTSTTDPADRLFVLGNGTSNAARSNALTIYKSGLMNINDAYNMPLADGTANQVLTTDGAGNTNWQDSPANFALAKMRMSFNQPFGALVAQSINFTTAEFDLNSNWSSINDRFEVSESGYYRIYASFRSTISYSATDLYSIQIRINGVSVKSGSENHSGYGPIYRSVSTILHLEPGDYIQIFAFGQSDFDIYTDNEYTSFEVERIR